MPAFKKQNKSNGFTLIELLVVISIIAILSVIGMAVFSSVQKSARDARRRMDIEAIAKAFEMAKSASATSTYPTWCDNNWSSHIGSGYGTGPGEDREWSALGCGLADYIQEMPLDPVNKDGTCTGEADTGSCPRYMYHICSPDGASFDVGARLENGPGMEAPISNCSLDLGSVGTYYQFWITNQQ